MKKYTIHTYRIIRHIDEKDGQFSWLKILYARFQISIALSTSVNFLRIKGNSYGFDRLIWDEDNQCYIGIMANNEVNNYAAEKLVEDSKKFAVEIYDLKGEIVEDSDIFKNAQWGQFPQAVEQQYKNVNSKSKRVRT